MSKSVGGRKMIRYIDFGFAIEIEAGAQVTGGIVGTPGYMAPEIKAGRPYACKADVWSLGVVFFQATRLGFSFCFIASKRSLIFSPCVR